MQPHAGAAPVQTGRDLLSFAQLSFRRYVQLLDHPVMGPTLYEETQAQLSLAPASLSKAAPRLGDDTTFVLGKFLGYSGDEVRRLLLKARLSSSRQAPEQYCGRVPRRDGSLRRRHRGPLRVAVLVDHLGADAFAEVVAARQAPGHLELRSQGLLESSLGTGAQ